MSDVTASVEAVEEVRPVELSADVLDDQLIGQLVDRARASGLQLTGEGELLQQLTKRVLETATSARPFDVAGGLLCQLIRSHRQGDAEAIARAQSELRALSCAEVTVETPVVGPQIAEHRATPALAARMPRVTVTGSGAAIRELDRGRHRGCRADRPDAGVRTGAGRGRDPGAGEAAPAHRAE